LATPPHSPPESIADLLGSPQKDTGKFLESLDAVNTAGDLQRPSAQRLGLRSRAVELPT
jgi:hypothetical protein